METLKSDCYTLPLNYPTLNSRIGNKFPYEDEVQQILLTDRDPKIRESQYPHRNLVRAVVLLLKRNRKYNRRLVVEVREKKEADDITSTPITIILRLRDRVVTKIHNPPRGAFSFSSGLVVRRKFPVTS